VRRGASKWCKQCQSYYAVQRPHSLQSATLVRCSVQSASIWCAAACDAAQRRAIVPWCSVEAHVDLSGQNATNSSGDGCKPSESILALTRRTTK
jgi:hypothetical protein